MPRLEHIDNGLVRFLYSADCPRCFTHNAWQTLENDVGEFGRCVKCGASEQKTHPLENQDYRRVNTSTVTFGTRLYIARDFILQHKNADLDNWSPYNLRPEQAKLERIFNNLEQGEYGDVTTHPNGTREVEIGRFESATGNPILFEWRYRAPPEK